MKRTILVLSLLLGCSPAARADKIVLEGGQTLEGKITESGDCLRLKMIDGIEVVIPHRRVQSTVTEPCLLDAFAERHAATAPGDVGKLLELARWCDQQGVWQERRAVLQELLQLDPDHAEARRLLGYQRFENTWYLADALIEQTRQPLTAEQRVAAEQRLAAWTAALPSAKGLQVLSAPAGLCVHVAPGDKVASDKFKVRNIEYLQGRTPLSRDLPPGQYLVSIERVTAEKIDFLPESLGYYQAQTAAGFLHAALFEVQVVAARPAYAFGLFCPQDTGRKGDFVRQLAPRPLFAVDSKLFEAWAQHVGVPPTERAQALDCLRRAGKVLHVDGDTTHLLKYGGPDRLSDGTLRRR